MKMDSLQLVNFAELPADVLLCVAKVSGLRDKLSMLCVCKTWNEACVDPSIWAEIDVPRSLAPRLWDDEFISLIKRSKRGLTSLRVSGSGISSYSLLAAVKNQVLSSSVSDILFDHCVNLTGLDIVHFVESVSTKSKGASKIEFLAIEGCNQIFSSDISRLLKHVEKLDVGICVCNRISTLRKCKLHDCLGLCKFCYELFEGCGLDCGRCNEPQNSIQEFRVLAHRVHIGMLDDLRPRWRDVRHGLVIEEG